MNTFIDIVSVWKNELRPSRTTRTPENLDRGRKAVLKSLKRSEHIHAAALTSSDHTARRILYEDLKFYPHKFAAWQKLNTSEFISRKRARESLIENLPHDILVFSKVIFHGNLYYALQWNAIQNKTKKLKTSQKLKICGNSYEPVITKKILMHVQYKLYINKGISFSNVDTW